MQVHDGGSAAAKMRTGFGERSDDGQSSQQREHAPFQIPNAFAVNNADLKNAARLAFAKICRYQLANVFGTKRVKIENTIDRQIERRFV